jgi:hypothetical protein
VRHCSLHSLRMSTFTVSEDFLRASDFVLTEPQITPVCICLTFRPIALDQRCSPACWTESAASQATEASAMPSFALGVFSSRPPSPPPGLRARTTPKPLRRLNRPGSSSKVLLNAKAKRPMATTQAVPSQCPYRTRETRPRWTSSERVQTQAGLVSYRAGSSLLF